MKIFRAIDSEERKALIGTKNIFYPHKTCVKEEWVLKPHKEDYNTGKFFFFRMEDALYYARQECNPYEYSTSILVMEIEDSKVLPYLGYGIYCYEDYNKAGEWESMCDHAWPELLIPYSIVEQNLSKNKFQLFDIKKDKVRKINMLPSKKRNKNYVNMGEILFEIKNGEHYIGFYNKLLGNKKEADFYLMFFDSKMSIEDKLIAAQNRYQKYKMLFPKAFANFMQYMKEYKYKINSSLLEDISSRVGGVTRKR